MSVPPKEFFITVDCGNVTLGICFGTFESPASEIKFDQKESDVIDLNTVKISGFSCGVFDLCGGQGMNIKVADRFRQLKKVLDNIKVPDNCIPKLYIERQMGINFYSNQVFSAVCMYFINKYPDISIYIIGASQKNTICLKPEFRIQNFYASKPSADCANKTHTAENFRYYCQCVNFPINKIERCKHEHVGDAFMQMIALVTDRPALLAAGNIISADDNGEKKKKVTKKKKTPGRKKLNPFT